MIIDTSIFQTDPGLFVYHASMDGQRLEHLSPFHPCPLGDWGDGAYLSDNEEISKIWGASSDTKPYLESTVNSYWFSDGIYGCRGYIIDSDNDWDLIRWASSVALPRTNRLEEHYSDSDVNIIQIIDNIETLYEKSDVENVLSYDWIISRRSDDGLWRFLIDFFNDDLSIQGLREVYKSCSFGDQLVLKTASAADCLNFNDCEVYLTSAWQGQYQELTKLYTDNYQTIRTMYPPIYGNVCKDYLDA